MHRSENAGQTGKVSVRLKIAPVQFYPQQKPATIGQELLAWLGGDWLGVAAMLK